MEQAVADRTRVAVLGTLAEFRPVPIPYDFAELVRFVARLGPDLLCLDMTLDQWLRRDFGGLPPEYRDALLPLAYQTDIVVVPIGNRSETADMRENLEAVPTGARRWLHGGLRTALAWLQRQHGPVAFDQGLHHATAEVLLYLIDRVHGSEKRQRAAAHRNKLVEHIVELARRDPGRRILAVVNVSHCHHLRRALLRHPAVALVRLSNL